jgi:hypothetical protein
MILGRLCLAAGGALLVGCGSAGPDATAGGDAGPAADADATLPDAADGVSPADRAAPDGHIDAGGDVRTDVGGMDAVVPDAVVPDAVSGDVVTGDAVIVDTGTADVGGEAAGPDASVGSGNVLTHHNDNARTGAYLGETVLNVSNVHQGTFGKLFARAVDDQLYAQPLYMSGVPIPGQGVHNVLYVATMNDSVYAFDADDPNKPNPLWRTSFVNLAQGVVPVTHLDVALGCGTFNGISGNIGIESTPVIDASTGRMFVVAKTKDQSGVQTYRLHALDVRTGLDQAAPVVIQASVPGMGWGSSGGVLSFDASLQNQRASLLLANGSVYIGFAAYSECGNYHGWLIAYDASTLAQTAVMTATANGGGGGIWMSGAGPSADATGNIYAGVGNGDMNITSGGTDISEALVKLTPALALTDWFVTFDYQNLNNTGQDFGSTAVLLIPQSTLALTGSEGSKLYVNDTGNLGHWNMANDSQIVQSLPLNASEVHGSPVAWALPTGTMVYVWAAADTLRAYRLTGGQLVLAQAGPTVLGMGQPGASLALSANGTTAGTGILWVTQPASGDASQMTVPGILQAFDATNVTTELWDSLQTAGDDCGGFAKFTPPTVANGKVYLPSFANQVCVYGHL